MATKADRVKFKFSRSLNSPLLESRAKTEKPPLISKVNGVEVSASPLEALCDPALKLCCVC